jgi:hypothetical protein
LTFGYVGSFFDFDPSLIISQQNSKSFKFAPAIAYTANLGNGISASLSMEDSTTRRTNITTFACVGTSVFGYFSPSTNLAIGTNLVVQPVAIQDSGFGSTIYSGQFMPDFIANLRVDQGWGDAQISGAIHQLKTSINTATVLFTNGTATPGVGTPWAPVKYGFAGLAGINFKLPALGAGDSFQIEGAWAKGAEDYTGISANPYSNSSVVGYRRGSVGPVIDLFDSFVDSTGQHLTKSWSVNAELRHFWTPSIRSSIAYGHNVLKTPIESHVTGGVVIGGSDIGFFPSGKIDQVSTNLIWSPVPKLDLGVEGVWVRMSTDCGGEAAAACAADLTRGKSVDFFGGVFRARRDF